MNQQTILDENRDYWNQRASGYSEVNQDELNTTQREIWRQTIVERISRRFPHRAPEEIRVLEVGTGPGFFAIILAEAGYQVTAIDLTPNMLLEAKKNAGPLADRISFLEMNAEALDFADDTFDVLLSRNLTWNLPHPELAYREWTRVLHPDGLLLNFDANWYGYLFDDKAMDAYENDRKNSAALGQGDQNVGENFDVMEDIALRIPMSKTARPAWDIDLLSKLNMKPTADEDIWRTVWSPVEQVNFASTPMFLIEASYA